jgi:hypothetical protein
MTRVQPGKTLPVGIVERHTPMMMFARASLPNGVRFRAVGRSGLYGFLEFRPYVFFFKAIRCPSISSPQTGAAQSFCGTLGTAFDRS